MSVVGFSQLAGVDIRWGTWDRAGAREIDPNFKSVLDYALQALWDTCPWGKAKLILSQGARVDKPGRHRGGTAFDLTGISWADQPIFVCRLTESADDWARYLAIEATLRRHVPQVLNWWEPRGRHRDHWHLDDRPVSGFQPGSHSDVSFTQAAMAHLWGRPVSIDGRWGPETAAAATGCMGELGGGDIADRSAWDAFLESTALAGFGLAEAV